MNEITLMGRVQVVVSYDPNLLTLQSFAVTLSPAVPIAAGFSTPSISDQVDPTDPTRRVLVISTAAASGPTLPANPNFPNDPTDPSATIELFTLNFQVNAGAAGGTTTALNVKEADFTRPQTTRTEASTTATSALVFGGPMRAPGRHRRRSDGPDRRPAVRSHQVRAPQRAGYQSARH